MAIDLSKYTNVLNENFDGPLDVYDGTSGVWRTTGRRDILVTNGPQSVFLSGETATSDGKGVGIDPLSVKDGVLHIGSGVIPENNKAAVADALTLAGQENYVDTAKYYTGLISTGDTWGQTYGYFEIKAQVPAGKGHWSAFWLAPAGEGWPPEIDIFEAYGKGLGKQTGSDNVFNTAVFFDATDAKGNVTQDVNITNPYNNTGSGPETPDARDKAGGEQYVFHERTDAMQEFGADIYNEFWTYAVNWTPESITFYFGKDHDSLVEIYKTPTPADVNSPMTIVANDQISSTFGWNPVEGEDHLTFAEGNDLKIDYIKAYALNPVTEVKAVGVGATIVDGDGASSIKGTRGNDRVVTGDGEDMIDLAGGADTVFVSRGLGNKIISGFGGDDKIVLDGFFFDGVDDVMARLTQVGNNVWLSNGAAPKDPQTILFQNAKVSDFRADDFQVRWSVTPNIWTSKMHDPARLSDRDGDGIVNAAVGGSKLTDTGGGYKGLKTLIGSEAGDQYHVYNSETKIVEKASAGVDTVYAYKSFTLSDNLENIVAGAERQGLILTGNGLGNRLEGTAGGEVLIGLKGDDLSVLGGGADRLVYNAGDGFDTVSGFGADDVVELRGLRFGSFAELAPRLVKVGLDTVVDLGAGQSITLKGIDRADLGAANFVFETGATNVSGHVSDQNYVPTTSSNGVVVPEPPVEPAPPAPVPPVNATPLIKMTGTTGADTLVARTKHDYQISGGAGNDSIKGCDGRDALNGDDGDDKLFGLKGDDTLHGGNGNDRLTGADGNDALYGDAGDDQIIGGLGNDRLFGGSGKDTLVGGLGNDTICGQDGDDLLKGDAGNDTLDGGRGKDRLFGGEGADIFVFSDIDKGIVDRVIDFSRADGDKIDLSGLFTTDADLGHIAEFVTFRETKGFVEIRVDRDGSDGHFGFDPTALIVHASEADVKAALIL